MSPENVKDRVVQQEKYPFHKLKSMYKGLDTRNFLKKLQKQIKCAQNVLADKS